jgi:glyoxalase family protein
MRLDGIHHVTCITGDAPANVDFYAGVLGLRLVKKTVNQDDPTVYHLFYADEKGSPGSDITFFEYPGAAPGRAGAGMVHTVVWRVGSTEALDFWAKRLDVPRDGKTVTFSDPEGLQHELVVTKAPDEPLIADHPEIPRELALQGFEGVRAYSARPEQSARVLEQLMGAERTGEDVFELRGQTRGGWIALDPAPEQAGRQSGGSIHHIAWATTKATHQAWLDRLNDAGVRNSGLVDRHYFESIYFREPGGVLYELATLEPGFTVDGPVEELGTTLILPPFLEPRRDEITARLTPLPDPRAGWKRAQPAQS